MNNPFFKIILLAISLFLTINNSHANPACYKKMRSLNLSIPAKGKQVCEPKEIKAEPIKAETTNLDKTPKKPAVGMQPYFVYPHTENEEEATTADGVGANVSVGF